MTSKELFDALPQAGAGFVDEFLWGVPEFIAKKVNRQATEDWIKKNEKAYRTGEVLGTLGSLFIPMGGVAKLAKGGATAAKVARGAKAADTAMDLAKLAKVTGQGTQLAKAGKTATDWGKISQLAKRGALYGAAEGGVRGVTSESDDVIGDATRGGMFGAGGGVLGGLLAKNLGRFAGEAKKKANQFTLGRTPLRGGEARRYLKDVAGPGAKGLGKFGKAEDALDTMADVVNKNKLYKVGADDVYFGKQSASWKKLDEIFEKAMPDARGSEILEKAIDWDEMAKIEKMPGGKEALERLQNVLKQATDIQGLPNIRMYLSNIVKSTFKAPDENAAAAERAIANMLRRNLDEGVMEIAERAGVNIDLPEMKRTYLADRALADAFAREIASPGRINTGSPTMEKLIGATIGGGIGAQTGEDLGEKARNMMIGGLAGYAGKRSAEGLANLAISKGGPLAGKIANLAPKLAENIPEAAMKGGRLGGQLAGLIGADTPAELKPKDKAEAQAVDLGTEAGKAEATGDPTQYRAKVEDRIAQFWVENGLEVQYPGQSEIFKKLIEQMTDGYAPEKTAAILFPDAARRKKYLQALEVSRQISSSIPDTLDMPGSMNIPGQILGNFDPDEKKAKEQTAAASIQGVIANALKATGDPDYIKRSRQLLQRVIDAPGGAAEKKALLQQILSGLGVDFESLAEAGVMV